MEEVVVVEEVEVGEEVEEVYYVVGEVIVT